jgi:hypothetical protein
LNLTFEEALRSEKTSRDEVDKAFPIEWKREMLKFVEYRTFVPNYYFADLLMLVETTRLDKLASDCFNIISQTAWVGETIKAVVPGIVHARDVKVVSFDPIKRIAHVQDVANHNHYDIGVDKIKRNRVALSKKNISSFLRESTTKENWNGAPWLLKPEIKAQFGIVSTMPPDVRALIDSKKVHLAFFWLTI